MESAPDPNQVSIHRAVTCDHRAIWILMEALELSYPAMDLPSFWVARHDGEIVGAAELKELPSCSLLSCVGVRQDLQGLGIGRILVDAVVRHARRDVYLYTRTPEFFRKLGFADAALRPPGLPPRSIYGCEHCDPQLCFCLVRRRHDS